MTSLLDARSVLGSQEPRICHLPAGVVSSAGEEAIELAAMCGLTLDLWQRLVLDAGLSVRADKSWAAFEVGLVAPRQNGKNSVLEARELAGLFLLGERLIVHSAHQFDTSLEAFRRLLFLIESSPDLESRVKRVSRSHGDEGIELVSGQRIRFRTRTKGGGRGFSGDCLVLDEAMELPESAHGALLPTLSAQPNPQVWYTGSAVDENIHDHGLVFTRVRDRGLKGEDPRLAFFEFSPDIRLEDAAEHATDPQVWAAGNPGLGIRLSPEHVASEQRSMDARTFAVERLGIGAWPSLLATDGKVISATDWNRLIDARSNVADPVCLAFDVTPDRAWSSLAVAGVRTDGLSHVEIVDRRRGTGWVVDRIAALAGKHQVSAVVCDASGPAASLLAGLAQQRIDVSPVAAREYAQACGGLFDAVKQESVRHLGTSELLDAVKGAARRQLGDAWAWSRKSSGTDISPLVAVTLALWAVDALEPAKSAPRLINLAEV